MLAATLDGLAFQPVERGRYFQWIRRLSGDQEVKLDLLVGPLGAFRAQLKTDKPPRVRPRGDLRLHAHTTEEAIEIDTQSVAITLTGKCSDERAYSTTIYLPHTFTYLMMKLFAYDDRKHDVARDVGRHHAMDLYRIIGMMVETDFQETLVLSRKYATDARIERVRNIVVSDFCSESALGMLRFREHNLYRPALQSKSFRETLAKIFSETR